MKTLTHRFVFLLIAMSIMAACGGKEHQPERNPDVLVVDTATSADGTSIVYQRKGSGSPVIVLVHGWSCDRSYWREQFDSLALRYTVVAIDLAGHGASGNARKDFTMAAFGADIKAVADKEKLGPMILAGHSMGGAVILEAARAMPDRVLGLIGVDTYQDVAEKLDTAWAASFINAMQSNFTATTRPWVRAMLPDSADPALAEWIVSDMSSADPVVAVSAFSNYMRYDHMTGFTGLGKPVYCINADLWPTQLDPLRRVLPAVELTLLRGVGHFVMLEAPQNFLAALISGIEYIRTHADGK